MKLILQVDAITVKKDIAIRYKVHRTIFIWHRVSNQTGSRDINVHQSFINNNTDVNKKWVTNDTIAVTSEAVDVEMI